jgi:hypothetical protein
MPQARQNWIPWLLLGALSMSGRTVASAQSDQVDSPAPQRLVVQSPQTGSLAGRLTNLRSAPLAGVSVVLRNQATGVEAHTTTAKNGVFRFASLDAGEYTLEADAAQLGHGRLEEILVTGGIESRVQAAMNFERSPPALLEASAPPQIAGVPPVAAAMDKVPIVPPTTPLLVPSFVSTSPITSPNNPPAAALPAPIASNPQLIASISEKQVPDKPAPIWPDSDQPLGRVPLEAFSTPDAARPSTQPTALNPAPSQSVTQPAVPARVASFSATSLTSPTQAPTKSPVIPSPIPTTAPSSQQSAQRHWPIPVLPERAALETQSGPMQLALAATPPHPFPLNTISTPILAAAVPTGILPAALLNLPPVAAAVTAAQPSDPVTPAVSTTMNAPQLQALPASGRRWQEFLLDAPAAGPSAGSSQASFRGSQESAEVAIDGANIRVAFGVAAGSATHDSSGDDPDPQHSMSQSWTSSRGLGMSEAAIREVTTVAGNVEAEGMRSAGGRTTVSTESGGNAFHGQGFIFDRQNTWGARNPFTQWLQNTGSASAPDFAAIPFTPPDHETVWGVGMGSHILRDKLFWFAALDSNRRNDPGLSTVRNPDEFFNLPEPTSASVTLLSAQLGESQNQAYNDYLGVATSGYAPAGLEQLASLLGPAPRASAQWVGFARLDWQAAERHRFTLEGIGADSNAPGGGLSRVSETYGSHSYGSSESSQQWMLARWEAYLTTNLLAVTQGSAGRTILSARPDTPSTFEQSFLGGNSWGQLPQIVVDSRYGFTIGNPSRFGQGSYPDERLFNGQEMIDWVHSKLLVKAGFELDHNSDAVSELRNQTGTYSYSTVASFISDALAFQKFGLGDALDSRNPHNCGVNDTTWGSQPCYSYYSQTMGPTNWHLSTNDWAGYVTAQWQLSRLAVISAGLRWEREEMPPPIASLANPELTSPAQTGATPPLSANLPSLGNNWGPRLSLAIGNAHDHWPVLRLGYGMYYGRTENATIETALTQTGSPNGDLNFFMRPSDDCQHCSGGAPPFPYVFVGEPSSIVAPGAVGFAPSFHNPEVHQAIASIEETLPGHVMLTAGAMLSLGRRLPISVDTNFNPAVNPGTITYSVKDPTGTGPIKSPQITVPFYASWPFADCPSGSPENIGGQCGRLFSDYQQIAQIASRANSTYEAAMVKLSRYGRSGLSFHAQYTYAHAMDWNPNETTLIAGSDVLDPANFSQEYGTSNLDVRHSAAIMAIFEAPWKLRSFAGRLGNGWMLSSIGQFRSGLPYTMRTSGSLPEEFDATGGAIVGLGPGMNGSGGDARVYGTGSDGRSYNLGRNTFRYPNTWKADLRLAKRFDIGEGRQLEILAETFNLFNHQNVTAIETTGYSIENSGSSGTFPTLCYLTINTVGGASCGTTTITGAGTPIAAFGQPLDINATDFYRERQIEIGLRLRF